MRLLVLVNLFAPDRGGGGAVFSDMCYTLADLGVEVTVYCPYPFYPEWRDKSERNGLKLWRYRENGVNVVRYGFFIPRKPKSIFERLLFESTLALSLLRLTFSARRYDAVMAFYPFFNAIVAASVIRLLFRKPFWLNVQDIASGAASASGMVRSAKVARLFAALEQFFFNRADVWSSISPLMIERLSPLRRRMQPILFLPNWIDRAFMDAIGESPEIARSPGSAPRLLYAGNIGAKQNLLQLCKYLRSIDIKFEFRIFGDGGVASELKAWLKTKNDHRFKLGPFLDPAALAKEFSSADFYVITEQPRVASSFFPSKLVTGMGAGVPILAICDPSSPLGEEMRLAQPGPRLEWSELDKVPPILELVVKNPRQLRRWRANGLTRARFYDRDATVARLRENLERICKGKAVNVFPMLGEVAGNTPTK